MSNFNYYSEYYDLLYKDKDYEGEVEYIDSIIKKYKPNSRSIIDFGCGTGNHDEYLAQKGYEILGVDLSETMIKVAKEKFTNEKLKFCVGDLRSFRNDKKYDVATSLFHVMSYQVTNRDIVDSLKTVYQHLDEDGIFIFDFWYGPAVLSDLPSTRIKKLQNEQMEITRLTESKISPNENIVQVNFEVLIEDKKVKNSIHKINEIHNMRYLFLPEMIHLLHEAGFCVLDNFEWRTFKEPSLESWYVILVCKK